LEYRVNPYFWMIIVYPLIRCRRLGLCICSSASSEMKPMSILLRFSVLFAGMVGLNNAEKMDLREACTRFQSGEGTGLFIPMGFCTIFLHVTSKHENDWFQLSVLESLFKCVKQFYPDFETEFTVSVQYNIYSFA
jgi:hypothetical protein